MSASPTNEDRARVREGLYAALASLEHVASVMDHEGEALRVARQIVGEPGAGEGLLILLALALRTGKLKLEVSAFEKRAAEKVLDGLSKGGKS